MRSSLACALAGASLLAGAPAAAQSYLYVASQTDVSVAVIDMATDRLVATVDLKALGFGPNAKAHDTAVEPDGSFWYVSLIAAGKVLKLDRDNHLVGQADFETPGMLALDPTSDRLYVGRSMAAVNPPKRIGVIRRTTMEIEEVDVFFSRPHAIAVDPVGRRFITASLGENRVAWTRLGAEDVDLLDLDGSLHTLVQLAVSPDGSTAVAGGQMTGDLLVFDLHGAAPRVARKVHVGGQPWHPVFTPDGRSVYVPQQTANSVSVVSTHDWTVSDVITHPALVAPHGSAVSPDGRTVYVSSHGPEGGHGTVVAIDAGTHEVRTVIEVGSYAAGMSTATRR